jgi:hypothetical protein
MGQVGLDGLGQHRGQFARWPRPGTCRSYPYSMLST